MVVTNVTFTHSSCCQSKTPVGKNLDAIAREKIRNFLSCSWEVGMLSARVVGRVEHSNGKLLLLCQCAVLCPVGPWFKSMDAGQTISNTSFQCLHNILGVILFCGAAELEHHIKGWTFKQNSVRLAGFWVVFRVFAYCASLWVWGIFRYPCKD